MTTDRCTTYHVCKGHLQMGCALSVRRLSVRRSCNVTRAACIPGMHAIGRPVCVCVCVFFFSTTCFSRVRRVNDTCCSADELITPPSRGRFRVVAWPPCPARAPPPSVTPSPVHYLSSIDSARSNGGVEERHRHHHPKRHRQHFPSQGRGIFLLWPGVGSVHSGDVPLPLLCSWTTPDTVRLDFATTVD